MKVVFVLYICFLGWFGYKMYGEGKYGDAVQRYCATPFNHPKIDSISLAADKLDPGSFFSFNP